MSAPSNPADVPWRGLHPLSLVVNLAPRTWRTLRGSWPLLIAMFIGGRRDSVALLLMVSVFFLLAVGSTVVHFLTLRYRIVEGRLQMRSGLLNRQDRVIDPGRIQNTELVRNPLHKIMGLVELRVETAAGREVEGLLSALSEEEGARLIGLLDQARQAAAPTEDDGEPEVIARADVGDLLRYGATGLRLGAGIAIALGLGFEGLQLLDPAEFESVPQLFAGIGGVSVVIAFVSGLFLLAVFNAVQRFWNFTLTLADGRLVAEQGLFTTRRVALQVAKIQLTTVQQPWSRRLLGFASVHVETAAAHVGERGTTSASAVVPVVEGSDIGTLLGRVVPASDLAWTTDLHPPHPRALRRGMLSAAIEGLVIGVFLGLIFGGLAWLTLAIAPVVDVCLAWLDYRYQGWRVTESFVLSRSGYLNRKTHLLARHKIQSVTLRQGPILRRWDLASVVVRVAGSRVKLPLLSADQARELVDVLRPAIRPLAPQQPVVWADDLVPTAP